MSTNGSFKGPKIVKDGLILYVDPSHGNSYKELIYGKKLRDISGSNNTIGLISNPVYSSSFDGMFTLNGNTQYIDCSNSSTLQITTGSISAWVRATSANNGYRGIITKQNAWGLFLLNNVFIAYDWGNGQPRSTGYTIGNNNWCQVAMTFTSTLGSPSNNATLYLNGVSVLTATVKNLVQTVNVQLGYANFPNQYLSGDIAQCIIYNRVLDSSEILQNYNATKSRFGL